MRGQIVCSKAGRDKDYFMAVVGMEGEFLLVCDGKERPLERPKRKNPKHITLCSAILSEEALRSNKSLKKALAVFKDAAKQGRNQNV